MAAKATSRPEGRPRPVGISGEAAQVRTQGRGFLPANLARVNEAARRSRQARFTALLHHVNGEALGRAFKRLRRKAASGVDGMTVEAYEQDLGANLRDLCDRVHSGRYRPLPVRRTYIPKVDGGQRPLGVLALEDKIVQGAVGEVLSAVYETDFLDCSYGFRPGRSAHQALRQVHDAILSERVNWVFDADIHRFFDSVDHDWLLRMIEHRIADPRIVRLIRLWLRAGVMENGVYADTVEGTPQGAGISPLLANIFLHYVLDLWVGQWQRRHATGRMRLVRYADDYLLTFERRPDAERMAADLAARLAKFGLQLNEDKTRLIEFGRFAAANRRRRGQGRPEAFDFLGFTHYCGQTRDGRFMVQRKTQRKRVLRKLKALRREMKRRMHASLRDQQQWLSSVLRGHYAYYGITGNARSLSRFYHQVVRAWRWALRRRGQRPHLPWDRFRFLLRIFPLPPPRIVHSWRYRAA
ncbi:MAG: group II intron reverse transcriptase/maturase [Alphaproteobacteria bacterium]